MCSIAIPSEHILGHSPPVYGSLLYNSLMVTTPPIATRTVPPRIRPCLSTGSIHLDGFLKNNDDVNSKRNKKKVVFADDRGRPLTYVRVMSEPSNVPPLWTSAYVAKLVRGDLFQISNGNDPVHRLARSVSDLTLLSSSPDTVDGFGTSPPTTQTPVDVEQWEIAFPQPASDYMAFRNRLDQNSVSLENIIVRENERQLMGTVKVKNIAFDKCVSIRYTTNNWLSYEDLPCTYVEQRGVATQPPVRILFDTFKFEIPLPTSPTATKVEFCVRYRTKDGEYWDNNGTQNYVVFKRREVTVCEDQPQTTKAEEQTVTDTAAEPLVVTINIPTDNFSAATVQQQTPVRSWSEFACLQQQPDEESPYW